MPYRFEGKLNKTAPRELEYTFYLSALDKEGNYSEPHVITVSHPRIQKLNLSPEDIKELITGFKIKLPHVYTKHSQEVYPPELDTSEEKDIIAYRLHAKNVNTEEELEIDIDARNVTERYYFFPANPNTSYEFKVGAYDSVYHPTKGANSEEEGFTKAYEETISDPVIATTPHLNPFIEHKVTISAKSLSQARASIELTTTTRISTKFTGSARINMEITSTTDLSLKFLGKSRTKADLDISP